MGRSRFFLLITFDVYTALFDIEGSLLPVVNEVSNMDALSFIRAWRSKQLEYALISNSLGPVRIPFEELTRRSLDDTLFRHKLTVTAAAYDSLRRAWLSLRPWGEAAEVLTSLKERGHILGLLSNGDTALLHELMKKLPPVFEYVFSSEQAGYYKPHPSIYELPFQTPDLRGVDLLHVAGSPTDVLGAKSAGLRCAWSNRFDQPYLDLNLRADHEMNDLRGLLRILT